MVAYSVFLIDGSPAQLFSLVALLSRFTLDITLKIALEVAHRQFAFQSKQYWFTSLLNSYRDLL